MQEDLESSPVDFLTVVWWWNILGLPAVLVAVVVAIGIITWRRGRVATTIDGCLAVRRIGLLHYVLAARALVFLVQELLTLRVMGIPQSPIVLIGSSIAVFVNPLLGRALGGRPPRRRARRGAIAWYTLLVLIATYTAYWMWKFQPVADAARWPEHVVSLVMPWFLWIMMFLPRVRHAFTADPSNRGDESTSSPERLGWPWVSPLALCLLIIVSSTLAVELIDWAHRMIVEPEEIY